MYDLLIGPIELVIRSIFTLVYRITSNVVPSIFAVSIVVSFLTLPLYNRADLIEKEEREKQKKMEFWKKRIQKAFKGEERFYMLSAYNKEQNYSPIYSLRSVYALIIQIPFFLAAYHFLSNSILLGESFLWIKDLGMPDRIIVFSNGFEINVLPILMTLISYLSGAIYTKGLKWTDKWQTFLLPIIFLILLYQSPSGLVLYWISNNLFSLVKNIINKSSFKDKADKSLKKTTPIIITMLIFIVVFCIVFLESFSYYKSFIMAIVVVLGLFVLYKIIVNEKKNGEVINSKTFTYQIILSELFMVFFMGIFIPISVIRLSPLEFSLEIGGIFKNNILYSFLFYSGVFLVWMNIIVVLSKKKELIASIMLIIMFFSVINSLLFGRNLGIISAQFVYEDAVSFPFWLSLLNIILDFVIAGLLLSIPKKEKFFRIIRKISLSAIIGIVCICIFDSAYIAKKISSIDSTSINQKDYYGFYKLSRNGKNVVVIMLDRAIGAYIPFIVDEKPELKEIYDGFTCYPNALSMAGHTNMGSPELWGGYEYTPKRINERTEDKLVVKHNEALKVLPVLFSENGYSVYLSDLPYANYSELSDMSIFDEYENIHTEVFEKHYRMEYESDIKEKGNNRKRNIIGYSLFRICPVLLKSTIYDEGSYLDCSIIDVKNNYQDFIPWYNILDDLPKLTSIEENGDCYIEICNDATHEPADLSLLGYSESELIEERKKILNTTRIVEGKIMDLSNDSEHYTTNVGVLLKLGEWLDYLKEEGVYDNTRIIIASDHGYGLKQFEQLIVNDELDAERFSCLLLVKDFGEHGFSISSDFMTNADVPTITTKGVITNPINPFTGVLINSEKKEMGEINVTLSEEWKIKDAYTFGINDDAWYTVKENIYEKSNWEKLESK